MTKRTIALIFITLAAAGCTNNGQPGLSAGGWSRERIDNADYAATFEAARYAASQWFIIAEARPDAGRIETATAEATERGGGERFRDVVRSPNTIRRKAVLRVLQQPKQHQIIIECTVTRQRLDTADARNLNQQRNYDESPNHTPIQTDAGVTREQAEVWTDIGRDRGLERKILDIARDRLAAQTGKPASAPAQ